MYFRMVSRLTPVMSEIMCCDRRVCLPTDRQFNAPLAFQDERARFDEFFYQIGVRRPCPMQRRAGNSLGPAQCR